MNNIQYKSTEIKKLPSNIFKKLKYAGNTVEKNEILNRYYASIYNNSNIISSKSYRNLKKRNGYKKNKMYEYKEDLYFYSTLLEAKNKKSLNEYIFVCRVLDYRTVNYNFPILYFIITENLLDMHKDNSIGYNLYSHIRKKYIEHYNHIKTLSNINFEKEYIKIYKCIFQSHVTAKKLL